MTILITGGAGFIGYNLRKYLTSVTNYDYRILDIKNPPYDFSKNYIQGDVNHINNVDDPIDEVVHLAAITGISNCNADRSAAIATNICGTFNVLEYCRKNDIPHLVFASSCALYNNPNTFYAITKGLGEWACRQYFEAYDIKAIPLRLANVYGPYYQLKHSLNVIPKFILKAHLGEPLPVEGTGTQTRDYVHVSDVCDAILKALSCDKYNVYPIASGVETSLVELCELINSLFWRYYRKLVHFVNVPMPEFRIHEKREPIDLEVTKRELGWKAETPLLTGLETLIRW